MEKRNCFIRHQYNYGEKTIAGYKLDGWDGSQIFEYYGCFFHGHRCCLNKKKYNTKLNKSMKELYRQTMKRQQHLTSMGYNVIHIWECEFKRQCETDENLKKFLRRFHRPLDRVYRLSLEDIIDHVISGNIFGAVECDISVPDVLREKFSEMSPIFKNAEISHDDIGKHMKQFAEHTIPNKPVKGLIGRMFGKKIILATP